MNNRERFVRLRKSATHTDLVGGLYKVVNDTLFKLKVSKHFRYQVVCWSPCYYPTLSELELINEHNEARL